MIDELRLEKAEASHIQDKTLASALVALGSPLRSVLESLDKSGIQICLVLSQDQRLEGIITDGDVRRAILKGASLEEPLLPFLRRDFVSVGPEVSRAEVLDTMQSRRVLQVPVLNSEGDFLGLHLLSRLLLPKNLPNEAVILAGGKGIRLRPVTENIPKPLLKVAGRPILERLVLHLQSYGIHRIHLAVNYLGHLIEQHFGDGSDFGCKISYLREESPLGTAGPLSLLSRRPNDPILVMNGDLVTQFNVREMLTSHERNGNAITIGSRAFVQRIPYGCLKLEGQRVVGIREKPLVSQMVNTGIYVVDPTLLEHVPRGEEYPMTTFITKAVDSGVRVGVYEINDDWLDIGQKDELQRARSGY